MHYGDIEAGVYAPSYFEKFKCIAERCRHSCCIDWEICIDGETYEKYSRMDDILSTVHECDGERCFLLRADGRCPHLNDDGLCNIIIEHGEQYLSNICREHPRFYNYIGGGRTEAGLGIVCEEACRLILENEMPFSLVKIDEAYEEPKDECHIDVLRLRDRIIAIIETDGAFDDTLDALKKEFALPSPYSPEEWLERFLALQILDATWESDMRSMRGKLLQDDHSPKNDKYYRRLLAYFVYRHVSCADSLENLRARLAFCILSVEIIRSMNECSPEPTLSSLADTARRYSAEIEYSEDNTDELIFAFENSFDC